MLTMKLLLSALFFGFGELGAPRFLLGGESKREFAGVIVVVFILSLI